ncbi:hypothetical protein [Paenibacillus sp. ISL-20]|uniref:hypothetical protein n=1 Tax=Paenibacillus sp. ISL-20 TaxID=2819163 RepID=UPI0020352EE2|nr:hypothetical protein [Paenibacillus sp. ISL-20]
MLIPLFEAGQDAGEIAAGDLRAGCLLFIRAIGLMTLKPQGDPSYTPPKAELLLRLLRTDKGNNANQTHLP